MRSVPGRSALPRRTPSAACAKAQPNTDVSYERRGLGPTQWGKRREGPAFVLSSHQVHQSKTPKEWRERGALTLPDDRKSNPPFPQPL